MRVVDDDRERLSFVDRLEAARDARHRADALGDGLLVEIQEDAGGDHAEHVLDVEAPSQRRFDLDPRRPEPASTRADLEVFRSDLGGVGQPERDQRRAARLGELEREPASVLVPDVHGRRRRLGPVKSRRFAWKYSSIVPCRSR